MTSRNCAHEIAACLADLGIRRGDTVLLHASYKSFGPVCGGIETVIQGFLDAIGREGTLLMPALSWSLRPPEVFDVRSTRSIVGAIPEYFRTRKGTRRSLHPTHSVCAAGRRANKMLEAHRLDSTPCGPHSPFRKLVETDGKIVMLGCGLRPNTTMHALEEYKSPSYLFGERHVFTIKGPDGVTYRKAYLTHGFTQHGYAQRYDRIRELETRDLFMREGRTLQAPTCVLEATKLKTAVLQRMDADPFFFVEPQAG